MKKISEVLQGVRTVGLAGHVRADGDCVGSCMGLYLYLKQEYPQLEVDVYLEGVKPEFHYIRDISQAKTSPDMEKIYDLFITLDVSAIDRVAVALPCFQKARNTVCIDHHVSNPGYAQINHIEPDASSTCEVLYGLLDPDKVTKPIAEAIYTGIIHDTGAFQYACTTPHTMEVAARLMSTGIAFDKIIEESFYQKTYIQNQVMGRVLTESILLLDGKCIAGVVRRKDMDFYQVEGTDMDGIVSQLRLTKGVEVAIFTYEFEPMHFKVSLRSNGKLDVNKVAVYFGGGGHIRAAGCEIRGTAHDVLNNLTEQLDKLIQEEGL